MLKKLTTPAVMTGMLGAGACLSIAFGKPALAAFLNDPATAVTASAIVGALLNLAAGWMQGPSKS